MKWLFVLTLFVSTFSMAQDSDKINLSGYGRVVAGYLDSDKLEYQGYSDNISFGQQTLIGLRADVKLSDSINVVGQAIAHTSSARKHELQWLYLDYQPTRRLNFRLGRFRMPLFNFSETNDVGFAYPWISPPQQVYIDYLFLENEGIMARYEFSHRAIVGSVDAYYGNYEGDFTTAGNRFYTRLDDNVGFILNLDYRNFNFRTSYHQTYSNNERVEVTEFRNILERVGFTSTANGLSDSGEITFYQVSLNYDTFDYFIRAEWMKMDADFFLLPSTEGGYITAGYNFSTFSTHFTFATNRQNYNDITNQIPLGISPQLNALNAGFERLVSALPEDSLDSFSTGVRYDYNEHVALKAEVTVLLGVKGERSFYSGFSEGSDNRNATLWQLAMEWTF